MAITYSGMNDGVSKTANPELTLRVYQQELDSGEYASDTEYQSDYGRGKGNTFDVQRKWNRTVTASDALLTETTNLPEDGSDFPFTRATVNAYGIQKPWTRVNETLSQVNVIDWAVKDLARYKKDIDNSMAFDEFYKGKLVVNMTDTSGSISDIGETGDNSGLDAIAGNLTYKGLTAIRKTMLDYDIPMFDGGYWKLKVETENEKSLGDDLKGTTVNIPVEYRNSSTIGKLRDFMVELDTRYLQKDTYGEFMAYGKDSVAECVAQPWEAGQFDMGYPAGHLGVGAYIYTIKTYKKIWDLVADKTEAIARGYGTNGIERVLIGNKQASLHA